MFFSSMFFFFFFQAEDGIRDVAVTGVQTCALPISRPSLPAVYSAFYLHGASRVSRPSTLLRPAPRPPRKAAEPATFAKAWLPSKRSEERRVGKECRSRWWAYH